MNKLANISTWMKSNPLATAAGALTTAFGLIVGASNVIPVIQKMLDLPDCLTYAQAYRSPWSNFKLVKEGTWREYPLKSDGNQYEFKEFSRTRDNIDLLNLTPRPDVPGWETLVVRLPVCGGTAKIAIGIPQHWGDLAEVVRE